jgi:hypothetical protein
MALLANGLARKVVNFVRFKNDWFIYANLNDDSSLLKFKQMAAKD